MANESKEEQIRKILRPLSHEKIIDILADLYDVLRACVSLVAGKFDVFLVVWCRGATVPGAFDKIYSAASLDVVSSACACEALFWWSS